MVRWELWASPTRLEEPLPAVGSEQWVAIANTFVEVFGEYSSETYTKAEGLALQKKMDLMAKQDLAESVGFTKDEIERRRRKNASCDGSIDSISSFEHSLNRSPISRPASPGYSNTHYVDQ